MPAEALPTPKLNSCRSQPSQLGQRLLCWYLQLGGSGDNPWAPFQRQSLWQETWADLGSSNSQCANAAAGWTRPAVPGSRTELCAESNSAPRARSRPPPDLDRRMGMKSVHAWFQCSNLRVLLLEAWPGLGLDADAIKEVQGK